MKVIILAGGKGTRLPQSARNIPKPLIDVAGKPILQHQIDLLEKHGLTDIRLSLGYMPDKIIKYLDRKYKCEYVIEPKPLGTGGAIKFASKDLKEDFMVLNGDILSDINLTEFIAKYQYNVSRETLGIISLFYCEDVSDYGLVQVENKRIIDFLEKPSQKCSGHINAGFYILSPKVFENVSREIFSIERDIFPEMVRKRQLLAYVHKGYWTDLGTEERLKEARKKFN